jgi:hypothetical protein
VRKHQKPKPTQKKPCEKDRRLAIDFVTDQEFDRLLDRWFANASGVLQPWRGFFIWGGYASCGSDSPFQQKHELYFSLAIIRGRDAPVSDV